MTKEMAVTLRNMADAEPIKDNDVLAGGSQQGPPQVHNFLLTCILFSEVRVYHSVIQVPRSL